MHLHSRQQSKVCLQTYFLDGGEGWRRHRNTTPGNFHSLGSCLLPGIKKRKTKQQQQHKKQRKFYTRKCDFNLLKKIILIKQSKTSEEECKCIAKKRLGLRSLMPCYDYHYLRFGVLQGSVLDPMRYLLYASPLENIIKRHNLDFHFYADNTQLYLPSISLMQLLMSFSLRMRCVFNF